MDRKVKVAICFSGYPRNYEVYYDRTCKNLRIFDSNINVDTYAHFWWSNEYAGLPPNFNNQNTYAGDFSIQHKDYDQMYILSYGFKKWLVEPQKEFNIEGNVYQFLGDTSLSYLDEIKCRQIMNTNLSQWYSFKKCVELIENPYDYDLIVRCRPDLKCFVPIDYEALLKTKLLYVQDGTMTGWDYRYADWFWVGPPEQFLKTTSFMEKWNSVFKQGVRHIHLVLEEFMHEQKILHEVRDMQVYLRYKEG